MPFSEGLASVRELIGPPYGLGYIDHTGKIVIAPQFQYAYPFCEGLAQVTNSDHLTGFIDHSGKWVIPAQYTESGGESNFSEGLACVGKKVDAPPGPSATGIPIVNFIWGYIDKTGTQVIPFQFTDASAFHDGLAVVSDSKGYGYIDKSGAYAFPARFRLAWSFSEGLARVQTGYRKMSYINPKGEVVFSVSGAVWADPFSDGLANVEMRSASGQKICGYIDHTGAFVIKPQFQAAGPFVNGLALAALNGEEGYIDKSGTFVWKTAIPAMPNW
jgi:hypothetical protein